MKKSSALLLVFVLLFSIVVPLGSAGAADTAPAETETSCFYEVVYDHPALADKPLACETYMPFEPGYFEQSGFQESMRLQYMELAENGTYQIDSKVLEKDIFSQLTVTVTQTEKPQ